MTSLALACRLGAVTAPQSIPRRVRTILNKYGATMLLPGVSGAMRFGYQPGNYRESTGQTNASVDGAVGLVLDAAGSVGANLVTSASGVAGTYNGETLVDDVTNANHYVQLAFASPANRTQITAKVKAGTKPWLWVYFANYTAGSVWFDLANGVVGTQEAGVSGKITPLGGGEYEITVTKLNNTASTNGAIVATGANGSTAAYTGTNSVAFYARDISVRELPGIHATQSTSGFQPVLRNTAGIQSWQFDGTDDRLSLSSVPFQMSDDHWVVVGAAAGSLANNIDLFSQRSSVSPNPILMMRVEATTGAVQSVYRDDAGTLVTVQSAGGVTVGTPFVGAIRQVSGVRNVWRDLSTSTNSSTSLGATTFDNAAIGASLKSPPIGFHSGHIHGVIFGKGAITDAELLTLERFVASLQGRTL